MSGAGKADGGVGAAAADKKGDFVDVEFGAKLEALENRLAVLSRGAKIVVVDEVNILEGRAERNDASH